MKKILALICFCVSLLVCYMFIADPSADRREAFGPEITKLQLGASMTWPDMVYRVMWLNDFSKNGDIPGKTDRFGAIISDKPLHVLPTPEEAREEKWIRLCFWKTNDASGSTLVEAKIMHASNKALQQLLSGGIRAADGGIVLPQWPEKWPKTAIPLERLYEWCKENGLDYARVHDALVYKDRLWKLSFSKEDLDVPGPMDSRDFAEWTSENYHLGRMERNGSIYEARHPTEGWRAYVEPGAFGDYLTISVLEPEESEKQ